MVLALMDFRLVRYDDIIPIWFGESLITADNIPYKVDRWRVGNYALARPKYYNIKDLPPLASDHLRDSQFFSEVFFELSQMEYTYWQQDPNQLESLGGDCQAFSIYLVRELKRKGIESGFIPLVDHIYCWMLLDGRFYKVDLTTRESSALSRIDLDRVIEMRPDLSYY